MKRKALLLGMCLVLLLVTAGMAFAANPYLHYTDCKNCHFAGATTAAMSADHICLKCHVDGKGTAPKDKLIATPVSTSLDPSGAADLKPGMINWKTSALFSVGDASNKFGHNSAAVKQTSHNWAASNTQPAAGSGEPVRADYAGFYSRYGASSGKLTCSRCHNPHGEAVIDADGNYDPVTRTGIDNPLGNPKLLVPDSGNSYKPIDPEKMCRACHATYASMAPGNHGLVGHPVNSTTGADSYASVIASQPTKYKATLAVPAAPYNQSYPTLIGGKVTCLSCHNLHYVDSNSTTADGLANSATLGTGDGNLLKGDGTQFVNDATRSTTFCNSCHQYDTGFHGAGASAIGCMGCHGGHNNTSATPSYYMLNSGYTTLPTTSLQKSNLWGGTQVGVQDGFCEGCHGNLEAAPFNAVRLHIQGEDCTTCHLSHGDGAFSQPIGCDGCHGSPPRFNSPGNTAAAGYVLNGYAWAPTGSATASQYSYSTSGHLKDESSTPHTSHAGATARYSYQCKVCHNTHIDKFATTHNKDNTSFRDVLEATSPYDAKVTAGAAIPAYNDGHPTGTCGNIYCHSNGGVNNGAGVRTFGFTAASWAAGGKSSIVGTANECGSCHGNDATDMLLAGKSNSTAHIKHLNAGFSCNTCHTSTAASATAYQGAGIPATHLNKSVDVAFTTAVLKAGGAAATFPAGSFNGEADTTCDTVYCHSNGNLNVGNTVYRPINWATGPFNLTCTSCHNIPGAAGDKQTTAHAAHVNGSTFDVGRNLDCGVCHDNTMDTGNNGVLGTGGLAFHVNGQVEVKMNFAGIDLATCSNISCHSDGNFESGATLTYKYVPWTATAPDVPLACDDCHGDGAGKSYPAYANGGLGVNSNSHEKHVGGGIGCAECHSQTTSTNTAIDGSDKTKHVNRSVEVNGAKITSYTDGLGLETCSAALCHGAATPKWGGTVACGSCHAANNTLPDSHATHYGSATLGTSGLDTKVNDVAYVYQCGSCHNSVPHANQSKDVAMSAAWSGSMDGTKTCSSVYCHSNGAGTAGTNPQWGVTVMNCGSCHAADPATARHTAHVNNATYNLNCSECHVVTTTDGTSIANKFQHVDKTKDVNWGAKNSDGTAYANAATACANIYCHSNGVATTQPYTGNVAVQWDTTTAMTCGSCHDALPVTNKHTKHINAGVGAIMTNATCDACHSVTAGGNSSVIGYAQHVNKVKNVDIKGTLDSDAIPGNNFAGNACANVYCHSDGKSSWTGVSINWTTGATTCVSCHGTAGATTTLTASHLYHIGTDATDVSKQFGYTCDDCHAQTASSNSAILVAGVANHVNKARDVAVAAANGGTGTIGGDFSADKCSTTLCHGSSTPTWTAGATTGNCSACHGMAATTSDGRDTNGDTANTDAQVGAHVAHLTSVLNYTSDFACTECHKTTVDNMAAQTTYVAKVNATGHFDSAIQMAFGTRASTNSATPAYVGGACNNTYCHDAAFIGKGYSDAQAGTVPHPSWADAALFDGTVNDCNNCHGYPPNPVLHPNSADCSACHLNVIAADNAFIDVTKHVNGTVEIEGGSNCLDCHGAGKYKDPLTNEKDHGSHTSITAILTGKSLTNIPNDYGNAAWWYGVSYDASGKPLIGCGQCHPADPANHLNSVVNTDLDPAGELAGIPAVNAKRNSLAGAAFSNVTGKCSSVYCHSNGNSVFADTPVWDNVASNAGMTCASCHGNSPTTGAHATHAVGIHFEELYDNDGVGIMAKENTVAAKTASGGSDAAHGNTVSSDVIGCQSCHNSTVANEFNAGSTVCGSCHTSGDGKAGSTNASIKASSVAHLDGAKSVAFQTLAGFKSKAQLRNNLADVSDVNSAWTRTGGYKVGASYDAGKRAPNVYDGAGKTCSTVDCHNGNQAKWTDSGVSCTYCHTSVPQ